MRRVTKSQPDLSLIPGPSLGTLRLLPSTGTRATPPPLLDGVYLYAIVFPVTFIGRSLHNGLVLLDPAVSREHARLVCDDSGWWIENIAAHNPLWVDEREIAPAARAAILPGQLLRLGSTRLQLVAPDPGALAAPVLGAFEGQREATPDDWAAALATVRGITAAEASGTQLLSPGVTLQFALKGRIGRRAGWLLALAALLVFVISAIITLGTAALIGQNALASGGLGHVLAATTIPLVPVLGVALVVLALDRYEREPVITLLGAFLWGAVIAIPPVLFIERGLNTALQTVFLGPDLGAALGRAATQALSAGVTEETIKGAGLLLLLLALRDEFDNVTDGAIYGALIGAGFAMIENFVYFAVSPRADLSVLILGRVVLGWLSHSTFTALFGIGIGYAREARGGRRRVLAPLAGLVAGITLHSLFDFVAYGADALAGQPIFARLGPAFSFGALLADYMPLFVAQLVLLRIVLAALRREAECVREFLAAEVLAGVVTPDEYVLLQDATLRGNAERRYALTYGPRAYLTARALHQTATGLAFRKWHVALGDPPKPTPRQPEDAYRARVARLRRSLLRQIARGTSDQRMHTHRRSAIPTLPLHHKPLRP